ncbi:PDZ domain-containing protein, partial [Pandoraea pneumonica]
GTRDLPLATLLERVGLTLEPVTPENGRPAMGVKTGKRGDEVTLTQVLDGGAAQAAGLSAGDSLVAIDGLRVTSGNLDK